jgi:hypothetical protein
MTPLQQQITALADQGLWPWEIAARLGCARSTVERALAGPVPGGGCAGRPAAFPPLTPEAVAAAAALALDTTQPRDALRGRPRVALALRSLAAHKPGLLPPGLAERLLAGRPAPDAVARQVAQAAGADAARLLRNPRSLLGITHTPLDNTWVDRDGIRREKRFGDWFVADDMTLNFPFWTEVGDRWWELAGTAGGGDAGHDDRGCRERFGLRVARAQFLAFMDCGTLFFLGNSLWSQATDAYGGYAIMWTAAQVLAAHGKPRGGFRFERGAWKSAHVVEPLARIGCPVINAQSANGKIIEGRLNVLQDIMAARMRLLGLGRLHLGKNRGEFTEGKKLWLDMRAGKADPRAHGVPHISEMQRILGEVMDEHNRTISRGKTCLGRAPEELRAAHLAADAPLAPLSGEDRWRLMPGVAHPSLRDGLARVRSKVFGPDGVFYSAPALFSALGRGYPVEVRYDIAGPDHAAIFSDDPSSRITRGHAAAADPAYAALCAAAGRSLSSGIVPGEFLGVAKMAAKMPGEVLADWAEHRAGHDRRKDYMRHARAAFQAVLGRGRRGGLVDERHDGRGNSLRADGAHLAPLAPSGDTPATITRVTTPAAARRDALTPSPERAAVDAVLDDF